MNVAKSIYFKMDWSKSLVPSALEKQNTSYKHVLLGGLAGFDSNKSTASSFVDTNAFNNMSQINDTYLFDGPIYEQKEFIFDRKDVRIIFITLYTLVFCCCFFGECDTKLPNYQIRVNSIFVQIFDGYLNCFSLKCFKCSIVSLCFLFYCFICLLLNNKSREKFI